MYIQSDLENKPYKISKRNFLDEEKEIEKLLSEFESENIKIPGE